MAFSQHLYRHTRLWDVIRQQEVTVVSASPNKTKDTLRNLYPALEANRNATIKVDDMHTLFYQEYGQNASNKDALIALFLHGGPGAGCYPNHARFFDPDKYRIVLLDQRGSGQSTPRGEVQRNTLQYLIQDCETLRNELDIQQWDVVLGGSWGTTLAIAYAQTHSERVRSIVLRGVCLMRPCEIDWLFSSKGGAASLDPAGWKNFSSAVGVNVAYDDSPSGRAALFGHYNRLLGSDPITRLNAARSWMMWEMRVSSLARKSNETENQASVLVWEPDHRSWSFRDSQGILLSSTSRYSAHVLRRGISAENELVEELSEPIPISTVRPRTLQPLKKRQEAAKFIPAQAMLTSFYSLNERYATGNVDLLAKERMDRLRDIPCIAIQGGNDTICPPDTALDLHDAWPEMELRIPTSAGHSMYDPLILNELVLATDCLATRLMNAEES